MLDAKFEKAWNALDKIGVPMFDDGDNRNSTVHGYIHPRFWSQESFEKLIIDISKISKFSGF